MKIQSKSEFINSAEFNKSVKRTIMDLGIKDLESKVDAKIRVFNILYYLESNEDCYEYKLAFWTAVYEGVKNFEINN